LDPESFGLERTRLIDADGVSHLTFHVQRSNPPDR
jgi:hypothetical protein